MTGLNFNDGVKLFALMSVSLCAQVTTYQLGSPSDPCTGGSPWQNPPMRYGPQFTCTLPVAGIISGPAVANVTLIVRQPQGVPATPDWTFTVSGPGIAPMPAIDVNASTQNGQFPLQQSFLAAVQSDGAVHVTFTATSRNAVVCSIFTQLLTAVALGLQSPIVVGAPAPGTNCPSGVQAVAQDDKFLYVCASFLPGQKWRTIPLQ